MTISVTPNASKTTSGTRVGRFDWRAIIFRGVILLILALVLVQSGIGALFLSPWVPGGAPVANYTPELHRWHGADIAALTGLLICGSLLTLFLRPRGGPLLAQFALVATGALALFALVPPHPTVLVPAAIVGTLVAVAYPAPRALFSLTPVGAGSRPLIALTLASAVPLLIYAWSNIILQYTDTSEHAVAHHWASSAALAVVLVLGGLLTATRRPGWQALGAVLAVTYLYLGVAALMIPHHDGSWGVVGGLLALAGGVAFLTVTVWESRRVDTRR